MTPLPIYPGSELDWTVTLPEAFPVQKILNFIKTLEVPLLKKVGVQDLYTSEKLGKGLKNLTLRFLYRDDDKTLEQEAVEAVHPNIVSAVLNLIEK